MFRLNFLSKVQRTVSGEKHNGWPYPKIEHWPPMTYRNRASPTKEELSSFNAFLKTENQTQDYKELQPWIPFCDGRCTFCYFPVSCEKNNINAYLTAMKKALSLYAGTKYVKSCTFNELYVGGGSPTVLSNEQIADMLQHCRRNFNLSRDHSTKFTACTTSLFDEKISFLASLRVNQLDIGVQTFNDSFRKILKLQDSGSEAKAKVKAARKCGLRASIDMLYNLPGQSIKQWEEDLKTVLELEVESVDCYPLDLYPETTLAKQIAAGELPPANDDATELEMYLQTSRILGKNGYTPTCHNRFSRIDEDLMDPSSAVVGTGAGFFMGHVGRFLYSDIENIQEYISAVGSGAFPIARLATLTPDAEMQNAMMRIYVRVPVNRDNFKTKFGKYPEEAFPEAMNRLQRKQLVEIRDNQIQLTEKGDPWRFNIAWEFFRETTQ